MLGKKLYNYWIVSAVTTLIVILDSISECKIIFALNLPSDLISVIGCIIEGLISSLSFGKICLTMLDLSVIKRPWWRMSSMEKSFRTVSRAVLHTYLSKFYCLIFWEFYEAFSIKSSYFCTKVTKNFARNNAPVELKTDPFFCSSFW